MSEWVAYRNTTVDLALEHPPGWEAAEDVPGCIVVVLAPETGVEGFRANVGVTAQELPEPADLEGFTTTQMQSMARVLTDVRLIDRGDTSLLGRDGKRILVAYRQGIHSLALEQWWAVAGTETETGAVVVSASCAALDYDAYADTFARMAASLRPDDG